MCVNISLSQFCCNPKISKFHKALFGCQYVCTFDIPMYDTLFMKINQTFQNLSNINSNQILRKRTKFVWLNNVCKRSIFCALKNDEKIGLRLQRSQIFHNVFMVQIL
uniref:MAP3K epsilon protein kinase 1-like isoform X2 n=1 Tax=Rhizophora mucronata TaxID=61149 RepID=A0A2P2MTD8_RHIMU